MAPGLHTMRGMQAEILDQMSDHRSKLEQHLEASVRRGEESAVHRAEAVLGPPLQEVKKQLAQDVPALRMAAENLFAESRGETHALRVEHTSEIAQLRFELNKLREDHISLTSHVHRHDDGIASLEGARRDLWLASENVQATLRDATASLQARMQDMARKAAEETEERWCRKLQRKIEAAESVIREVDARCRRETAAALETVGVQQGHFENKLESLRLDAYQEAKRQAAEAAAEVRKEELGLVEQFSNRLEACQDHQSTRLSEVSKRLHEAVMDKSEETLARADEHATAKVTQMGANVAEAVDGTRNQLAALARNHNESVEQWRVLIRDTQRNADAADALNRGRADDLKSRIEGLEKGAAELIKALAAARQVSSDALDAVRAEVKEQVARWHTFEEVGLPGIMSLIERKTGETETRSVRAALDYAERLRKLPPTSVSTRTGSALHAVQVGASLGSTMDPQSGWSPASTDGSPKPMRSAHSIDAPQPLAPLPPLTPTSARRPMGR